MPPANPAPAPAPASRAELDDLALERARRGDAAACRLLVERYERPVFALLSRMLASAAPARVEDLAQETFLRVFRGLPRYRSDGPARLSTWILTIATRLAIDELRRRGRTELIDVDEVELSSPERTDRQAEDRSLGHAIRAAVGSLPPEYRAVFILRAYHDLDYREIATTLECDLGTVKSRLARARARLREQLEGDGHG